MSTLEMEASAFDQQLAALLQSHSGQYVVIKGTAAEHFSDTYESAVTWAYERFGLDRFFIRKVAEEADWVHFTRELPCRP